MKRDEKSKLLEGSIENVTEPSGPRMELVTLQPIRGFNVNFMYSISLHLCLIPQNQCANLYFSCISSEVLGVFILSGFNGYIKKYIIGQEFSELTR